MRPVGRFRSTRSSRLGGRGVRADHMRMAAIRPGLGFALSMAALVALLVLAMAPAASAGQRVLRKADARGVAAKTAQQVKRDLAGEGARRAGVAGCWRNSARRVSCYLKVTGYDAELDFRWTCMLRMVVELNPHKTGRARYKSRYGTAVCG